MSQEQDVWNTKILKHFAATIDRIYSKIIIVDFLRSMKIHLFSG